MFRKSSSLSILILLGALCWPPVPALAVQQTILVFGDSLSAGYGLPRESAWVTLLQQELQRTHSQYQVVNASISGETTAGGLSRIVAALREHRPSIVILELGANDGLRGWPLNTTENNLAYMIKYCYQAHAKVLLLGMKLPPNYGDSYTRRFHQLFLRVAKKYHTALMPFMLDGLAPDQFQADSLHPNAEAQPIILHNILRYLGPLMQQEGVSHDQSAHTRNQSLFAATCGQSSKLARLESGSAAPGT